MKQVFVTEGKADQVFKYLKLVSKYKGATTLGQLKKQEDKKKSS